jgi:hypothetical protein
MQNTKCKIQNAKYKIQNAKYKIQNDGKVSFDKPNSNDSVIKQISSSANVTIPRIIAQSNSRIASNLVDTGRSIRSND